MRRQVPDPDEIKVKFKAYIIRRAMQEAEELMRLADNPFHWEDEREYAPPGAWEAVLRNCNIRHADPMRSITWRVLGPNLHLAGAYSYSDAPLLECKTLVMNRDTGIPDFVSAIGPLPRGWPTTRRAALVLREGCIRLLAHEVDEWLMAGTERIFDPHTPKRLCDIRLY